MSRLCRGRSLSGIGAALIVLPVVLAGCAKSTAQKPSAATAGGASRNRQVLDYFLDNKKVQWSSIDSLVEGKLSPSGKLETGASQAEMEAFSKTTQGRPVPEAMRAVIEKALPMKADAFANDSSLSYQEAQRVVGQADSSRSGTIHNPLGSPAFVHGTMYRYGALDVLVDDSGAVRGLEVDLAHFKG